MNITNIINELPRAEWSIGKRISDPTYITLHYNGPKVNRRDDIDWYTFIANFHMRPFAFGNGAAGDGDATDGADGDGIMYHYAVTSFGEIYQMREDNEILWHCGNIEGNAHSIAVELAIGGDQEPTEIQWQRTKELFAFLCEKYSIPKENVKGHNEWKSTACPGPKLTPLLKQWKTSDTIQLSPDTEFVSEPRCTREQAIQYIINREHSETYTKEDIELIVNTYFDLCVLYEIDPLLLIAQMIHETGNLTSFWSLRPQRNPAGIGVNGSWLPVKPKDTTNWVYNTQRKRWEYGLSFPTWKDDAIPAHVARILGYVLTDNEMTREQQEFYTKYTQSRPLPSHVRGTAKQLSGLNTRWAVGKLYAASIIKIANAIANI